MDSNQLKNQIEQVANLSINNDDGNDKNRTNKIISCTYCALTFRTRSDLRQHCQTESHQTVIMSDEGNSNQQLLLSFQSGLFSKCNR